MATMAFPLSRGKASVLAACCWAVLGAGGAIAQDAAPIAREGSDWVQTSTGSAPFCASCRLHVVTGGDLVLRGEAGDSNIRYALTKRVRAATLAEAERLLRDFEVRVRILGATQTLTLVAPHRPAQDARLTVYVPRTLRRGLVECVAGDISVFSIDGAVEAQTAAGRLELDQVGSAAVRTGGGDIQIGKVAGSVRCFTGGGAIRADSCGGDSWMETAGGDIAIKEAIGVLHASSGGGNIQVIRSGGEVFAQTTAGVIEVRQAAGLVTANTSGGAIQVGSASGVRCESGAGAIRLRNVGGPVLASTTIGSILAELMAGARVQDSFLSTRSGDITVFISSNIPVTVRARNETAGGGLRIVSEFPEIRVMGSGALSAQPLLAEGMLNGGGPLLRIQAASGTIYLRRQK